MTYNRILSHTDATSDHAIDTSNEDKKINIFFNILSKVYNLWQSTMKESSSKNCAETGLLNETNMKYGKILLSCDPTPNVCTFDARNWVQRQTTSSKLQY